MNYEQATDDIQKMLTDAWGTTGYKIYYEGVVEERADNMSPFCRVFLRHVSGRQATLGGVGHRTFERNGFLTVQIFTPVGKGLLESHRLAKVVGDAFEGRSSGNGVWFRNVRINEIGKDGMFNLLNVIVDFEYHETK